MSNKPKTFLIVLVGFILVAVAIFAGVLLMQRLQASKAPAPTEETLKTSVVVVTRDLSLGHAITETDVTLSSVPVELAPRDAIATVEDTLGKIIKTDLVQGEMLLKHNLADPTNNNKDLSFILSEDHVLFAFPADDLMSRESVVQRGDLIDIFATFQEKVKTVGDTTTTTTTTGEPKEPEMRTFTVDTMQKISVTAMVLEVIQQEGNASPVPTGSTQPTPAPQTRTRAYLLALKPQDALILKHLKDTGATFDIVLRAPTSTVQFELTPVTEDYIVEYYGLEILP